MSMSMSMSMSISMDDDSNHKPQKKEQDKEHVLTVLESLKRASKDLQHLPSFIARSPEPAITAILELGSEIDAALDSVPGLSELSKLLSDLKSVLDELEKSQGLGLVPLIRRQASYYRVWRIAWEIEAQAQGYLDKEIVLNLMRTLSRSDCREDAKLKALAAFEDRVEQGFHMGLQDLILKSKVFSVLESKLCDPDCPQAVRECSASAIVALVKFNRNVFVGLVLMGPTVGALVSIGSCRSIRALSSLVRLIRSPLIDEMYAHGEITRIAKLLESQDYDTQISSLECVCEIAYYGRKEVVEAILDNGIVERLMELQRSEDDERHSPFGSCVVRFAVQVEVGEGLTQQEKREMKTEILRRVKEASVSEAEAASISAEVLWGSSPLSF
ncbi:hypothetical protein CRG98_032517 [Punica granatum]|uniref:Armadillo-like helical n=1 Tax=Punica granatum TaxID=22663 RepID=A0A2I0ISY5_PUNGR|nr:hypothetical protein CRG98_032517 [Punica granatum]